MKQNRVVTKTYMLSRTFHMNKIYIEYNKKNEASQDQLVYTAGVIKNSFGL